MDPQPSNLANGKLTVVGSINVDIAWVLETVSHITSPIAPGYTWSATSQQRVGGKGANAAIYAAGFHGPAVELICALGDDDLGKFCRSELEGAEIMLSVEEHVNTPTGRAGIITDHRGHNLIAVDLGANQRLSQAFVDDHLRHNVQSPSAIVTNLEISSGAALATVDFALRHNVMLIVDPSPLNEVNAYARVLESASILLPNQVEHEILMRDHAQILEDQQARGGYLVVTQGEEGVDIYRHHLLESHLSATEVAVADTVGAGDCFAGTLGACLAGGIEIHRAFALATRAASLSTQGTGAQGYIPTLREVSDPHLELS